ncbi:MAG: hypothetical protein JWR24_532 [Actinoallomurus sp.]|nr:hypothetical protein [Actinoallomurus sp.]
MGQPSGGVVSLKKYLTWAIAAFVAFYLLKSPGGAARAVHNAATGLASAGDSLSQFVNALT